MFRERRGWQLLGYSPMRAPDESEVVSGDIGYVVHEEQDADEVSQESGGDPSVPMHGWQDRREAEHEDR